MKIGGVDEAGRGPVIGPLVVAGVALDENKEKRLAYFVKDSKKLSPGRREKIFPLIKKLSDKVVFKIIPPEIVDKWIISFKGGLNLLEVKIFSEIIKELKADLVYVDSCDIKPKRFSDRIKKKLGFNLNLISEIKADERYPVVSAASIIAKVVRDKEIRKLRGKYGDFGSGYPSDRRTIAFLKKFYLKHKYFPPIVRKSYKTISKIINEVE